MPSVAREGDSSTGADGYPPTAAVSGFSPNVFVNGKPIQLLGLTHYAGHASPYIHTTGGRVTSSGSGKVFANGIATVRSGDSIADGDTVGAGSPNVFFG